MLIFAIIAKNRKVDINMYQIIIGFYLLYTAKKNIEKLLSLDYGISAYTKLDWVLLVLSIIMVPLSIMMFYVGYKDIKNKKNAEEQEKEIENDKRISEMYSDYSLEDNIEDNDDDLKSRFDS